MIVGSAAAALVDWGTTNLRLWLVDADGAILAERRADEGLLHARTQGFAAILDAHLTSLQAPATMPVMICGMAGSRQGWVEAPYVAAPASLDAVLQGAIRVPDASREIRIVPGVAQQDPAAPDVMRGEETQLAGIAGLRDLGGTTVCMPGTHSKWVEVRDGVVTRFATTMTGELFSVLSRHSILRHAIGEEPAGVSELDAAFSDWCREGLEHPEDALSLLFRIRASSLLQGLSPEHAAAALSGLLIGAEIGAARKRCGNEAVTLVASGRIGDLYGRALALGGVETTLADADAAVRAGLVAAARSFGMLDGAKT